MEYNILTSMSAKKVNLAIEDGWKPIGSHKIVREFEQLQYSGGQHKATKVDFEYSQTMIKSDEDNKV